MLDSNDVKMQLLMVTILNKISYINFKHLQENEKAEKLAKHSIEMGKKTG